MDEKYLAAILAGLIVIAIIGWFYTLVCGSTCLTQEQLDDDTGAMKKVIHRLKPVFKVDPVKRCEVYKREGCSHVDGPLCDMETCSMVVESDQKKIIPIVQQNNRSCDAN